MARYEIDIFPDLPEEEKKYFFHYIYPPAFYIDVGRRCNHDCPYCSVPKNEHFEDPAYLKEIVEFAGRHNLGRGIFIGGEPSIYPHLEEVMEHGRKHGVTEYAALSNGSGFINRKRVHRLYDLGLKLWHLSWDDFRPDVINALHGSTKTLDHLYKAIENINTLPDDARAYLYQVVVKQNYTILPEMVRFTHELQQRHPVLQFLASAIVRPVSEAWRNKEVLFPLDDAIPYFREAIAESERLGLSFFLNHLPPCIVPGHEDRVIPTFQMERTMSMKTGEVFRFEAQTDSIIKGKACLSCTAFESCTGYYRHYTDQFGDGLFAPPPSMRRATPLPESLLEPFQHVKVKAVEELPETPHSKGDADSLVFKRKRERCTEKLQKMVGELLSTGQQTHAELAGDDWPMSYRGTVELGDGTEPLRLHLAWNDGASKAFRSTEHVLVSYSGGDDVPKSHLALLEDLARDLDASGEGRRIGGLLRGEEKAPAADVPSKVG